MSLISQQTGNNKEDARKITAINGHQGNINPTQHPWQGLRHLAWERRDKNEDLINTGGKEICNQ